MRFESFQLKQAHVSLVGTLLLGNYNCVTVGSRKHDQNRSKNQNQKLKLGKILQMPTGSQRKLMAGRTKRSKG